MESTTRSHHTTLAAYMGPHGSDRLTAAQPANRRRQFPPPSSTPLLRVESLTTLVSSLSKDTSFHFFFFSPSSPPAPLLRSCSAALAWIRAAPPPCDRPAAVSSSQQRPVAPVPAASARRLPGCSSRLSAAGTRQRPPESAAAPACSRPAAPTRKPRLPHQQVDEIVVSCKVKSILSRQHRCLLRLFYLLSPSSSCAARLRLLLSFLSLRFRELLVEMTNLSSWMTQKKNS